MAIVWGSIVGGYGRIGIDATTNSTATETTVTVKVWFWSKYSVSDNLGNALYLDDLSASGSATTNKGGTNIQTKVETGSGWSPSNQVLLTGKSYTYTHTRGTSATTRYLYAKLTNVDRVGGTMYASTTVSVPALTSYTVAYNANGGSGAPSSQTKYYDKNITLSSTKPTRTGYTFEGWATSASGSVAYGSGASYAANDGVTLYAVWKANTYTVSYNANGGSGAPPSQTKTYDVTLTLSSTKPTRTNYTFLGWATSASATKATYSAGGSYTTNANTTLYAVWSLAYTKPRITNFRAERCDQAGNHTEDGTCVHVTASWECDKSVVEVTVSWSGQNRGDYDVGGEGISGFVDIVIGDDLISTENSYNVSLYVRDGGGDEYSSTSAATIPSYKFSIDCKMGSNPGVAIGKAAELEGVFDVALTSRFLGNRYCMSSPGEAGYVGYVLVAKIDVTAVNADAPITFVLTQRSASTPMTVHVRFNNSTNITTSSLSTIRYEGSNYGAFLVHADALEWYLYVKKATADDIITVQDWYTSKSMDSRIKVTFPGTFVTDMPQGLDGWHRATPAVLQSIIDCLLPVGMIIQLYSHADPNTMYPGTTWTRIQNAFLWGCDASGTIGQTGGEKTHTLTVDEMPKHHHGGVYSHQYEAGENKNRAWYTTAGTDMGFNANTAGGGAAHNNMPPYVQVSIWRRTA